MATNFTINDTGVIKVFGDLDLGLAVGIHPEEAELQHGQGPATIGQVAAVNEWGSADARVPARMWLRGWAGEHAKKTVEQIKSSLTEMVRTQQFRPEPFQEIADVMANTMREPIEAGRITPPNAPRTLKDKEPETRPLVGITSQFVKAIHARFHAHSSGGTRDARHVHWNYKTSGDEGVA